MRHTFVSMEAGELTDGQLKMLVGHSRNMNTFGVYRHEIKGSLCSIHIARSMQTKRAQVIWI